MDTVNLCAKKRWAFTYSSFFPPSYLSRMWVFKGTEHDQGPRRLIAVAEGERRGSPDLWMCQRKLNTPGTSRGFAGRAEKSDRTPLRRPCVAAQGWQPRLGSGRFGNKCRQKRPSHGYCLSPLEEPEDWKRCNSYIVQRRTEELHLVKITVKLQRYGSIHCD